MYELQASLSGSSTATSGAHLSNQHGDFIVGAGKKSPPYLWLGIAAAALVVAVIYLIRR